MGIERVTKVFRLSQLRIKSSDHKIFLVLLFENIVSCYSGSTTPYSVPILHFECVWYLCQPSFQRSFPTVRNHAINNCLPTVIPSALFITAYSAFE